MSEITNSPARPAALESIRRMQAAWPAWRWSEEMEREYGTALVDVGDPDLIRDGTTAAIRMVGGKFPPPLADLLATIELERRKRQAPRRRPDRSTDEAALRDALSYLACCPAEDREYAAGLVASVRKRLPVHGADVSLGDRRGVRFVEAAPHHYDPPGTVRYVVIQPDGRRVPAGARIAGEL